jgi:hypothetical protein
MGLAEVFACTLIGINFPRPITLKIARDARIVRFYRFPELYDPGTRGGGARKVMFVAAKRAWGSRDPGETKTRRRAKHGS